MITRHCNHFQCPWYTYRDATVDEVIAKLGADHVAWLLRFPRPDLVAEGRARGEWTANNLETMSAYERFIVLVNANRNDLTAALSRQKAV
jgi:hypothetical protein